MGTEKKYLSANEFMRDSWRLAHDIRTSGWRPDILLGLWRGGVLPGVTVHEFLKSSGWDVRHYPIKCASYSGLDENTGNVVFSYCEELFSSLKPGDKVLVVDDVFDSGLTALAVKKRLDVLGVEMKMACVYWKKSRNQTKMQPDFYVRDTGDDWIVFPHEMEGLTDVELTRKDPEIFKLLRDACNVKGE